MPRESRFDRVLPELFAELADLRTPDYLEAAIEHASSLPQRPAWTYPERWFPVQITTRAVPVPGVPWRSFAIVALVSLLAVAGLMATIGSKPRVPPAFGRAENGGIAIEQAGDIVIADPATGVVRPLVTGPFHDSDPAFSPDGTRIAFVRSPILSTLMVGAADGSGVVAATGVIDQVLSWTFSPDGRELLITARIAGVVRLQVVTIDGSRPPRELVVQFPNGDPALIEASSYRPPDGREILAVTQQPGSRRGLEIIDVATGVARTVVAPDAVAEIHGASWSPSGDQLAYGRYIPMEGITTRGHLVAADGTHDRMADPGSPAVWDHVIGWSNDGTRLLIRRGYGPDESITRIAVVSVAGDHPDVELACNTPRAPACGADWIWSPDDSALLGIVDETEYALADPATGAVTQLGWTGSGLPAWQRKAG